MAVARQSMQPSAEPETGVPSTPERRRNPWLAGLMSAMLPGLGQLYVGQADRALWLVLVFALASLPGMTLAAIHLPARAMLPALVTSLLVALGTWLYAIVDAVREARRCRDFRPRPWQTAGLYVAVFIVGSLILLPSLATHVRQHHVQAFRIPSDSMSPTLLRGDYLFADMRYNCPTCRSRVERGDAVVFVYPNDRTVYHVKRVIGLPGDRIVIDGPAVSVNGRPLTSDEPGSAAPREEIDGRSWHVAPAPDATITRAVTVPPGEVFVLGDNRAHSLDSREYGTVPLADVVGKARQLWFSRGAEGVRWNRIGRTLE